MTERTREEALEIIANAGPFIDTATGEVIQPLGPSGSTAAIWVIEEIEEEGIHADT